MNRKILSVLSVLMAVLMSTAALTGCNKTPAGAESSGGSGESMSPEQGGEPSTSGGESGAQDESTAENEQRTALFKELNEEYLPLYGILINCEEWALPKEISAEMFYAWYTGYTTTTMQYADRMTQYSKSGAAGWYYPAAEFEEFVQKYFNISSKVLRKSDVYNENEDCYNVPAGGWLKNYDFSVVSPDDILISGSTATAKLTCVSNLDSSVAYFYLSLDISEEPYKFVGCKNAAESDCTESSEQKKTQIPISPGEIGSVRASCSDIREFVLSKEAAQLVLSMTDGGFYLAEPCAYYGSIATYRLYNGTNTDYCTFRVEKSDEYTVEALSCRGPDSVTGVESEFYPTRDDGYPEEAFAALALNDIYSDEYDFDSAAKVEYVITAVGSGQATAAKDEIRRMREASESVCLFPIERFITSDYGAKFISNTFSYYKSADDEEPYCVIYTNLVGIKTADGTSRLYYPENPEEYSDRLSNVYFAILDEKLKEVQSP